MPRTLLLEAGFVSLPSDMFGSSIPDIKDVVGKILGREKFEFSRIRAWLTAKRVGLLIEGLSEAQADCVKEIRGPKASVAYDLNNLPTPAATGFASAQGLEIKDLFVREVDGEKFLFARKMTQGQALGKCVPKLCDAIFQAIPISSQPWFEKSIFPQPMVNLCAMLDEEVLNIELEGRKACGEVIYFDGLRIKGFTVDHASSYPQIMKQLGLMPEALEKRKAFEAKIRAVLPEGYLVRDAAKRITQACTFYENSQPALVRFENKFLEMPEVILSKVIAGYFGYLICEGAHGKLQPAAVALPLTSSRKALDETEIRSGMLNLELEKIWTIWNRDVHSLPGRLEKIAEQLSEQGIIKTDLFCDCSLMGVAEGLCDLVGKSEDKEQIGPIVTLIEEGEKTEIGQILQGTGFSVIFNRLHGVELFKPYAEIIKEICQFFDERTSSPTLAVSRVICLAILMQGHVNHTRCFDCSPERILNFLNCTGMKLDLFGCFFQLFPGFRMDRKSWLEIVLKLQNRDNLSPAIFENLGAWTEFDPASFFEAFREWKGLTPEEIEAFSGLVTRIRSKLSGLGRALQIEPEDGLEAELSIKMTEMEQLPGVDYLAIYKFYTDEKVNIEACLMNLPAVLDDTSSEFSSRISLLQRLQKLLSRMPFVRKEKRSEKN